MCSGQKASLRPLVAACFATWAGCMLPASLPACLQVSPLCNQQPAACSVVSPPHEMALQWRGVCIGCDLSLLSPLVSSHPLSSSHALQTQEGAACGPVSMGERRSQETEASLGRGQGSPHTILLGNGVAERQKAEMGTVEGWWRRRHGPMHGSASAGRFFYRFIAPHAAGRSPPPACCTPRVACRM